MGTIKNLLFDFGGVLVNLNLERCQQAFRTFDVDIQKYMKSLSNGGVFRGLENGSSSFHECCDELRKLSGNCDLKDKQIEWAWTQLLVDVPKERIDFLLKLKEHYHLFLLSNTNVPHWEFSVRTFFDKSGRTVYDLFEKVFLSYEMHTEKPSSDIFRAVAQEAGILPDETVFFDDLKENCEAAVRCGYNAIEAPLEGGWMSFFDKDYKLWKS